MYIKKNKNKGVLLEEWWGTMPQVWRIYLKISGETSEMVEAIQDVWR